MSQNIELKQSIQTILNSLATQKTFLEHQYKLVDDAVNETVSDLIPKGKDDSYQLSVKNGVWFLEYVEPTKKNESIVEFSPKK